MIIEKFVLANGFEVECTEIEVIKFYPARGLAIATIKVWKDEAAKEAGLATALECESVWETGGNPQLAGAAIQYAEAEVLKEIRAGKIK